MTVTSKKRAEIEERRKKVAANLLGGLTYRDMAPTLAVSIGTIANDVKTILGRWEREQIKDVDGWVRLELTRLDRALNAIWNKVLDGDLKAIDAFLSISGRRAKLLGLDAPDRVDLTSGGEKFPGPVIFLPAVDGEGGDDK